MRRARATSVRSAAIVWLTLLAAGAARAQAPAPPLIEIEAIGPGVYAALDGPGHKAGSNAGFVIGDDGVLVVDSFFNPDATREMVAKIHELTPKPIRFVVNTHYHIDHVSGDQVLKDAGAVIVAQSNVRAWIHDENLHLMGARLTSALRARIEALPEPDIGVDHKLTIWFGRRRIDLTAAPGHTGGDLLVSVPDARVVFCGDLLWREVAPNIIDGTVAKWIATDAALEAAPGAATMTYVPGHGGLARLDDVARFESYLADLSAFTAAARAYGLEGDALVAAVLPQMKARYGDWAGFAVMAPREVGYMDAELAGTKVVPVPPAASP
jgi:glyoxylase-like metal-dependent hydrolase (beta-lactamase superfamily II)